MKKRYFLAPLLGLLCLCLAVALSSCGTKDDGKDQFGYERPENCWLTDCLLVDEVFSMEEMFGTSGESGLASEKILEHEGKIGEDGTCYLVCLVYGTPPEESGAIQTSFDYSILQNMQMLQDTEVCDTWEEAYAEGDLSISRWQMDDDQPLAVEREANVVQGMLVIPFHLADVSETYTLYTELSLDVEGITGDYKVDACESLSVGGDMASTKAEIGGMSVRYLTSEAYNGGNYTDEALQTTASFGDKGLCYAVWDFTVKALEDNDGTHQVYAVATSPDRNKMAIRIEEAPSGSIEETFHEGVTTLYAAYNLPLKANEEKKIRMVFSLRQISGGKIDIGLFVSSDTQTYISGEVWTRDIVTSDINKLSYTLNDDERSYTVSGFEDSLTEVIIPERLDDGFPVTGIATRAFRFCETLTAITIPDSVTSIGYSVFMGCSNLESITVEKGNPIYHSVDGCLIETASKTLIAGCKNLVIPTDGSVTSIGDSAFSGDTGLTTITIPDSVTSIGDSAFVDCSNLTTITIPDSVTSIGDFAFWECTGLTKITIPTSVKSIGDSAFYGCKRLTGVYISDIEAWCKIDFADYDSNPLCYAKKLYINGTPVTYLVIPSTVVAIKNHAFSNCLNLTTITIPDSVKSIGMGAFYGCTNLIEKENGVSYVDKWAIDFDNSVATVTLRGDTVGIGDSAFIDCDLTTIMIPDSVTSIGRNAFYVCCELTTITIPDNVTSIGEWAFYGCGLTTVIFENTTGWCVNFSGTEENISPTALADPTTAAGYLRSTYYIYDWTRT